ncbi:MAG: carbamoyltransferase HypF [Selenomonadaceae bacterium]|nr:carbamoyltransferase HypF [Selenomonadaceae bacterium]
MLNIKVCGIVQGVGFRPFVARLADEFGIMGTVANKGSYVEIFAMGDEVALKNFTEGLKMHAPKRSAIISLDILKVPDKDYSEFSIIESEREEGKIFVSPDIAVCEDCKRELFDKNNRRYLHPFINCTACGPRLTILDAMPYDRERTSMGEFPMCDKCEKEYFAPEDRRYDAQPVCCNDCGPEVYILGSNLKGKEAIKAVRRAIIRGEIVAIKGIGGFHLSCDATNEEAVAKLRKRKSRPVKPFALMAKDMDALSKIVKIPDEAKDIIESPQKPILLLPRKDNSPVAKNVAIDNPNLGVMLPYAPIQSLIFRLDDEDDALMPEILIMTSGNPSGAPICHTDEEAKESLSSIADVILSHNRRIRLRADDSVMGILNNAPYMIRRSRGYAPLPVMMNIDFKGEVLAIGGELKNSFCLAKNELFYPSPFIGDMTDLRSVIALKDSVNLMESLLEIRPEIVAADPHPLYNTSAVAKELGLPVFFVQHHYAHILSCMAENHEYGEVLGLAFDGTGYGEDGAIWGGELLRVNATSYERFAHIEPFVLAGGDKVSREGYRIAIQFLYEEFEGDEEKVFETVKKLDLATKEEFSAVMFMLNNNINTAISTSAGRLFDGASAILGIRKCSTFEGEAAIYLEFAAEKFLAENPEFTEDMFFPNNSESFNGIMRTKRIMRELLKRRLNGENPNKLAYFFHKALVFEMLQSALWAKEKTNIKKIALSGGVFQNQLLTTLTKKALENNGFHVLTHSLIPPNDGGIALGQAFAAMAYLNKK